MTTRDEDFLEQVFALLPEIQSYFSPPWVKFIQ